MQITTETPSKLVEVKKWHVDMPQDLQPMKEKYAVIEVGEKLASIDPKDVMEVINRYATDLRLDTYSIAEIFNISASALKLLIKQDPYKTAWQTAKKVRAEKALQQGAIVASTPYDLLMEGKQIPGLLVKAAQLKANYSLAYARTLDPDLNPQKGGLSAEGDINIQINSAFQVKEM